MLFDQGAVAMVGDGMEVKIEGCAAGQADTLDRIEPNGGPVRQQAGVNTPMVQGGTDDGCDQHPNAFTMWMVGGGVKEGFTMGESDDLGFNVVQDQVHVHDLHATILHLLGFDHSKLTYRFQGRDFRLPDVSGEVIHKLLSLTASNTYQANEVSLTGASIITSYSCG